MSKWLALWGHNGRSQQANTFYHGRIAHNSCSVMTWISLYCEMVLRTDNWSCFKRKLRLIWSKIWEGNMYRRCKAEGYDIVMDTTGNKVIPDTGCFMYLRLHIELDNRCNRNIAFINIIGSRFYFVLSNFASPQCRKNNSTTILKPLRFQQIRNSYFCVLLLSSSFGPWRYTSLCTCCIVSLFNPIGLHTQWPIAIHSYSQLDHGSCCKFDKSVK